MEVKVNANALPEGVMSMSDFEYELGAMEVDGYRPAHYEGDAEIAERYPCSLCGGRTRYVGCMKDTPNSLRPVTYRAFVVCDKCGYAYEF